jgi:RNA polymerase-interacting CarD/CdnL/TRCF family regulator
MFQVGDAVIYPGYGAGTVIDIEELSCLGSDKQYYSIQLLDGSKTRVWVAVQDAKKKGIRRPIAKSKVDQIWRCLRTEPESLPSDHNERYALVREKLENGNVLHIAEALRDLSWKDLQVRSLTSEGKRLYDKGIKLLATEIATVQGDAPEAVEAKISRILSDSMAKRAT